MVVAPEGDCIIKRHMETETLTIDKSRADAPYHQCSHTRPMTSSSGKAVYTGRLLDMGIYNVLSLEDSNISENNFSGDSVPLNSFLILLD